MATTTSRGEVYDLADRFSHDLLAGEERVVQAMAVAWNDAERAAMAELDKVLAKIASAVDAGLDVSPAWLYQQARLGAVLGVVEAEVGRYGAQAARGVAQVQQQAAGLAVGHAEALTATAVQATSAGAGISASFVAAAALPGTVDALTGLFSDGTPVAALFRRYGPDAAADARRIFTESLTLGWHPSKTRRRLVQHLGMARTRAETIARTESLRVYREATRRTYAANADVLEGWVWTAALDARSCPACVRMHGTVHPIGSTLDGHPRCRCVMVPLTRSWEDLGVPASAGARDTRAVTERGEDWLKRQPATVQRGILGPLKFSAWRRGEVTLDDMVARPKSDRWGTMRRERTMSEIRAGRNANWDDPLPSRQPPRVPGSVLPMDTATATPTVTETINREVQKSLGLTDTQVSVLAAYRKNTKPGRDDYLTAEALGVSARSAASLLEKGLLKSAPGHLSDYVYGKGAARYKISVDGNAAGRRLGISHKRA